MSRYLLVLTLLFLFSFSVLAQESTNSLLFTYSVQSEENGYDSVIMDALTGEIIDKMAGVCFLSLSTDQQWLLYNPYDFETGGGFTSGEIIALNWQTGDTVRVADFGFTSYWGLDGYVVYSTYASTGSYYAVNLYSLADEAIVFAVENFFYSKFIGNSFFVIAADNSEISLHRWRDGEDTVLSFEHPETDEGMTLTHASLSPNRQFIAVSYQNYSSDEYGSYLIDINTGMSFDLNVYPYWQPQSSASLAYSNTVSANLYNALTGENQELAQGYFSALFWSPQGDYLELYTPSEGSRMIDIHSKEIIEFGENTSLNEWLSPSQFVYFQNEDIFFYDMRTREITQLTDTPDVYEVTGCPQG